MAICEACGREMRDSVGCTVARITYSDGVFERFRVGDERPRMQRKGENCGDCAARGGQFHHPGCDLERCPNCGGQLIMCSCGDRLWEDGVISGGYWGEAY